MKTKPVGSAVSLDKNIWNFEQFCLAKHKLAFKLDFGRSRKINVDSQAKIF